jgi:hypothetical protein
MSADSDMVRQAIREVNSQFCYWAPTPLMLDYARAVARAALSRARATVEKGGAPDCLFCSGRSTFIGDPARSFCDEHYRQYLLTFQIVAKDLAAYRARATQETNSE